MTNVNICDRCKRRQRRYETFARVEVIQNDEPRVINCDLCGACAALVVAVLRERPASRRRAGAPVLRAVR